MLGLAVSPYKATSIIDFWRRWHITLSAFLRDYLYIPLGGNRKGPLRRHLNLLATMVLGGLWHGASWTFVLWGGLHGSLLVANHFWRRFAVEHRDGAGSSFSRAAGWLVTFTCVCLAWVPFRADGIETTFRVYRGMLGLGPASPRAELFAAPALAALLLFTLLAPNSQQVLGYDPNAPAVGPERRTVTFSPMAVVGLAGLFFVCCLLIGEPSPFLYFQF